MASIRNNGTHPCPRCLIPKSELSQLGTPHDIVQRKSCARVDDAAGRRDLRDARKHIYQMKRCVHTKAVENLLKGESRTPTSVGFVNTHIPHY